MSLGKFLPYLIWCKKKSNSLGKIKTFSRFSSNSFFINGKISLTSRALLIQFLLRPYEAPLVKRRVSILLKTSQTIRKSLLSSLLLPGGTPSSKNANEQWKLDLRLSVLLRPGLHASFVSLDEQRRSRYLYGYSRWYHTVNDNVPTVCIRRQQFCRSNQCDTEWKKRPTMREVF